MAFLKLGAVHAIDEVDQRPGSEGVACLLRFRKPHAIEQYTQEIRSVQIPLQLRPGEPPP